MSRLARVLVALLPLALVPVLFSLLASGRLNLGGGDKDILLVLPWTLWSLVFAVSSFIFWSRGRPLRQSAILSVFAGLAALLVAAVLLAAFGQLGVGGV